MEVITVTPGRLPHPVELPNKRVRPSNKHVGHKSSGNGIKKRSGSVIPPAPAAVKKRDQEITAANKMVLYVNMAGGTRRLMRESEYRRLHPAKN